MEVWAGVNHPKEKILGPLLLGYLREIQDQSSVIPVRVGAWMERVPNMGKLKLEETQQSHFPSKSASPRPKQ